MEFQSGSLLNGPKLAKMAICKPSQLYEKWSQVKNLFKFNFKTAIAFEWYKKKFRQKWLVKKSKFVWRKKNPPRGQILHFFRYESRNKNVCDQKLLYNRIVFQLRYSLRRLNNWNSNALIKADLNVPTAPLGICSSFHRKPFIDFWRIESL